jgi:crossover junction endodeoxyribonuclease RuvC
MGYGVVAESADGLAALDYGCLTTTSDRPLSERLRCLYEGLVGLIARHQPTEVAVEELFFSKNVRTALAVGHARGVAMLAAANCGLAVSEYSPQQVKQAVAVYGRARKEQIQQMVQVLLDLPEIPEPDDAADALALAICHIHTSQAERLVSQSAWQQ